MKFRTKITIFMVWLLALAFGVGGSLLIALNFSDNFERERETALSSYKMIINTLSIVDETSPATNHSNLVDTLSRMGKQGIADWSAIRLSSGSAKLYEDNSRGLDLSQAAATDPGQGSVTIVRDASGGRHIRIYAFISSGNEELRLDLCNEISGIYSQRDGQIRIYRQVFIVVVILGAVISWALAYWLTLPLYNLSDAAKQFAAGDLNFRAPVTSKDEVGILTQDFNAMAEKLEDNISTIQDTAARQEIFMGNFAHEMKNPMTAIIGYAELIRAQTLNEREQMEAANYIFSEGKRLESLSLKLLDILVAKNNDVQLVEARPAQIIGRMVQHLERVYEEQGIIVRCKCEDGLCLLEPDLVRSLLVNLLDNARKAMDKGGNIYIVSEMLDGGCVIKVLDTGRGIPPEKIKHLTEAFFRVDKSRARAQGGAGLGLALCNEIVHLHNGTLRFESRINNGTCVTVELLGGAV